MGNIHSGINASPNIVEPDDGFGGAKPISC